MRRHRYSALFTDPDGTAKHIIYASSAVRLLHAEELADILSSSRRNNAARDVTGALLYADGNVLQVLEGPPAAVDAVYARVEQDGRHHRLLKFIDRPVPARAFPDWGMGLVRPEAFNARDRDAVRALWDADGSDDPVVRHLIGAFLASVPEPIARAGVAQ